MNILILSARRDELEFEIYEMPSEKEVLRGSFRGLGLETAGFSYLVAGRTVKGIADLTDFRQALLKIERVIVDEKIAGGFSGIDAVGHRVIHGGKKLSAPVRIDASVLQEIKECIELAPLHNVYNLNCIEAALRTLPDRPQVAVFDTAFHSTIPEFVKRYALPPEICQEQKIYKYGFHGISHEYIVEHTACLLGKDKDRVDMISCHLGRGGSVNAIKGGKSFDVSMGFTPLDGLIMSTRCGEIDAGAVLYLLKTGASLNEVENMLLKRSGLLGLTGISENMVDLVPKYGEPEIKLVIDMYVYRVRKYIGAYLLNLGRIDALTFTGGIGANSPLVRKLICADLSAFGIELDPEKNEAMTEPGIEHSGSKIKIFVIPRKESLMISRYVYRLLQR